MMQFGKLESAHINAGVNVFAETPGAILLDVRDQQEYREGHIPKSKNVPLAQLDQLVMMAPLDASIFVYAAEADRASIAAKHVRLMGFSRIIDLGSIDGYNGPLE